MLGLRRLLVKGGGGSSTYYQLADLPDLPPLKSPETSNPDVNASDWPRALLDAIAALSAKPRREKLWPLILWLCAIPPHSAEQLARLLNRQIATLKTGYLSPPA